jgi:putative ATP-dependent endonuclease of the OLD family
MNIEKVNIENYKCFDGKFSIEFNQGVNILVGDNEAGKSTILEAINLALTGILGGRYLKNELSQYLFNNKVVNQYIHGIKQGNNPALPHIVIEVFFSGNEYPLFEGNGNSEKVKKCGIVFKIEFDPENQPDYELLIRDAGSITTIPIEFYRITWKSCAREPVTARSIGIAVKSALIDSASNKYQNGSDIYISRIIRNLVGSEKVQLSQAYRKMKESFMQDASIQVINQKISTESKITEKKLSISVDLSTQNSWETTLMTYLDEIPFHQIGKGEQCIIKTNLALGNRKSQEANLILLEEPENHLSHTKLNELIKSISDGCADKQVIISTHSSFVANKLGLENILLLNNQKTSRLSDLSVDTFTFFKKLPGYQTLRLLLCQKAVLVEGDSDELIFQKAYMEKHNGHLPIEDGIDVISVKLTFERFLEIAEMISQPVAVITDNDHKFENKITKKYKNYENSKTIKIFADNRNELNTLEPQFVDANAAHLPELCVILEIKYSEYDTTKKITDYMIGNKTTWALKVFESDKKVQYPEYIQKAVAWCDEK